MQLARRIELAEVLRRHREELERTLADVVEEGLPLTSFEARLIMQATDARVGAVERALSQHGTLGRYGVRAAGPFTRFRMRLGGLLQPRIGRLKHYPPRILALPSFYGSVEPPDPAPAFSIVTPTFQHARFIGRCVESVVGQNYPNLEYVVQDGGSTDGTLDILDSFGERITRWVSEPDDGHADALNRAFAGTNGEIMGWLNSDDLLLPGSLAYVAAFFASNPDVDAVYGNRLMIDVDDCEIGAWILPEHDDLALTLADFVPQETLFWRRGLWTAAGGYIDESFQYALDWELLLRFQATGAKMVRLPRFLGAFRVHDAQRTSTAYATGLEEMARLRERTHGRPVSVTEVSQRLRPYLMRHVRAHLRYRLGEKFGDQRLPVDFGYRASFRGHALSPPLPIDTASGSGNRTAPVGPLPDRE